MRKSILAVIVLSAVSASAFATGTGDISTANSMTIGQKNTTIDSIRNDIATAQGKVAMGLAKFNNDRAHFTQADQDAYDKAESVLKGAQARIDAVQNSPTRVQQLDPAGHPVNIVAQTALTPSTPAKPAQQPQTTAPTQPQSVPMTALTPSQPAQTAVINQPAGSLPANTPVQTPTGVVPAGSLPPTVQVAVPHVPAIISQPLVKGGQQGKAEHGHNTGGSGNGHSNAQSTRSAEAHGFGNGGHAAAGGGRQGGGFHY